MRWLDQTTQTGEQIDCGRKRKAGGKNGTRKEEPIHAAIASQFDAGAYAKNGQGNENTAQTVPAKDIPESAQSSSVCRQLMRQFCIVELKGRVRKNPQLAVNPAGFSKYLQVSAGRPA